MSDIDDLLSEFENPGKQGYDRYIPDPAEALGAYKSMAQGGWDTAAQGFSQLGQFGSDPLSRLKGAGNVAMGGAQIAAAIPAAIGKYIGAPIGRGVEDLTGSSTAGQIVGGTAELAPAVMMPFPGATAMRVGPEAASMVAGELPAGRMAMEGIINKFAPKAGKAATSGNYYDDEFEDLANEVAKTRKTSAAADVDYRTAEDWYKRVLTNYEPNSTLPPAAPPVPKDIRLLQKGNPKVGERKYAQDEAGKPVVMQGYADQGGVPTFRTSHSPKAPQQQAPEGEYQNIFQREVAGEPHISQMPLHPGTRPDVLSEMWLPNVRDQANVDPRLLAELKLKFGGGSPQGAIDNPPWTPQQTAGVRPPAQMPIYGARPYQEPTPNVILPESPIPMGTQARETSGRLRNDLGLEPDPTQALQRARTARQEELARQPEAPPPDLTPAQAPKAVTQYGNIEVGQPYDIVMKMNGQEMRSSGGVVKELMYKDEPVVEAGKSVIRPVGYAVLEDGRQVPVKLLQRTGTTQPNVSMSAPATATMPKPQAPKPPVASTEQTADPAFAAVQKKMAATQNQPKDLAPVIKGIKQAFKYHTGKTTYTQMQQYMPEGTSRAQIDKALKELKKSKPNLVTATDPKTKEKYAVMGKMDEDQKTAMSNAAKEENFNRGIEAIRAKVKGTTTYLHNFSASEMDKVGANVKPAVLTKKINDMIAAGKLKVVGENTGKEHTSVTSKMITSPEDLDEDLLVTFVEESKKKAGKVAKSPKDLLQEEYDRGDITGTEFLDAVKRLEKKGKK